LLANVVYDTCFHPSPDFDGVRLAYRFSLFLTCPPMLSKTLEFTPGYKKSLKIPKGQSESVYRRRTDNTVAKRKSTKVQRSTKHTYKTKDRVTRTLLKTGDELRYSGRVNSSCSTSDTRRVNLVTNPKISQERRKDREDIP
jgi:hypothetical protein